ncbi:cell envelope-related function transcriptional attenuator common domain [Enterococcus faecalis]|nr:cell envelope-related function transcriptional attenuator common domain [Enterococcus faecalis]
MSRVDRYKHIHEKSRPAEHKKTFNPENQWVNIEKKNQKN